ncbi:MAG: Na+/H+ antiporter NhaA [Acidiferrobacteraceae bacterium]
MSAQESVAGISLAALILLFATLLALVCANSAYGVAYLSFWRSPHALLHGPLFTFQEVIDQGLMTLFFLLMGLELKQEFLGGALRAPRAATLPVVAAVGGMVVPAVIYLSFNRQGVAAAGWGVPISTDIAFALAGLALVGDRAPRGLWVFLLALAIIDDLGAMLVIAIAYTRHFYAPGLLGLLLILAVLGLFNRSVSTLTPYVAAGMLLWGALARAGINPPLAGALLATVIPGGGASGSEGSLAPRLQRYLGPFVHYAVMPLFALANADLIFSGLHVGSHRWIFLGVVLGLVFGKLLGVAGASWLALRYRLAQLPPGVTFRQILGAAWLSGIGFTMALFITRLAFATGPERTAAKLGVLVASFVAAVVGVTWLWRAGASPDAKVVRDER